MTFDLIYNRGLDDAVHVDKPLFSSCWLENLVLTTLTAFPIEFAQKANVVITDDPVSISISV